MPGVLRSFPGRLVRSDLAREVVGPAYDALRPAQRADHARAHHRSFLRVTRSPPDLPHASEDELLRANRAALDELLAEEAFSAPQDGVFLYELARDGHRQIGIVAELPVEAAADGRVLRHELTRTDRVSLLARHLDVVGAWSSPIAVTYRADAAVDAVVARLSARPPDLDLPQHYRVDQRVWQITDPDDIEALTDAFRREVVYIIDGHHRLDAALHHGASTGILVTLFPHDQLRVRSFHRAITDVDGEALLAATAARPLGPDETPEPERAGTIGVWVGGRWHRGVLPEPSGTELVDQLDVSRLQHGLLAPVLGVTNPRTDPRLHHLPASAGVTSVEEAAGNGVGVLLHPMPLDDLLAVADADDVMPPKSTSFEPKARSGVILRLLDDG